MLVAGSVLFIKGPSSLDLVINLLHSLQLVEGSQYLVEEVKSSLIMPLRKESLNSDGQQFHQYQQNEQSPLLSIHWSHKNHYKWSWKSRLNGIPTLGMFLRWKKEPKFRNSAYSEDVQNLDMSIYFELIVIRAMGNN